MTTISPTTAARMTEQLARVCPPLSERLTFAEQTTGALGGSWCRLFIDGRYLYTMQEEVALALLEVLKGDETIDDFKRVIEIFCAGMQAGSGGRVRGYH